MKKRTIIFMTLALTLGLLGCTRKSAQDDSEAREAAAIQDERWSYRLSSETLETRYPAADGTLIATVSYEQPILTLVNEAGETFSGDTPERGVTAEQLAVCKTFNDATGYRADNSGIENELIETGQANYEWSKEADIETHPASFEQSLTDRTESGDLLSVCALTYLDLGGAHPTNGLRSWNYDLAKGAFVELDALTDRPDDLRRALVDEIAAQINTSEEKDGYFEDWYDTLSKTTDFNVFFGEESMTVFFSEYDLGPHALGIPIFEISYDTFAAYLNDYGRQLLPLS